jgi:hypothetical protein
MSRTRNRFATAAVGAAGLFSAVLALSPTAAADPVTPTIPGVPGLDIMQQIVASPASAPQLLQSAMAALTGIPATPTMPTAPAPAAGASAGLPQPAAAVVPTAELNLPTVPGLPVQLPAQLSLPGDLASLVPGFVPMPNLGAKPAAVGTIPATGMPGAVTPAAAAAVPGATGLAALFPTAALP